MPFQTATTPWIGWSNASAKQTGQQVVRGQQETTGHDVRTNGADDVVNLILGQIVVVTPRHALASQEELREERHIETNEHNHAGNAPKIFVVHASRHLWPPMMQPADHADQRGTHHDIVEMRDNEIGVMQMHIGVERGQMDTGEPANGEQHKERQRVQHGRIQRNVALVQGGHPIEHLHGAGNSHAE